VVSEIGSRIKGAVTVAAVDPLKRHARYSSAGDYVELAAPGGDDGFGSVAPAGFIWQETFDFTFTDTFDNPFLNPPRPFTAPRFDVLRPIGYAGTSQATPHVAALAAMLMQQGITDPAAIEAALERFATDLGDPGRDKMFGFGLIQARDTLRGLGITK
jgi:subtilisin family serine protease